MTILQLMMLAVTAYFCVNLACCVWQGSLVSASASWYSPPSETSAGSNLPSSVMPESTYDPPPAELLPESHLVGLLTTRRKLSSVVPLTLTATRRSLSRDIAVNNGRQDIVSDKSSPLATPENHEDTSSSSSNNRVSGQSVSPSFWSDVHLLYAEVVLFLLADVFALRQVIQIWQINSNRGQSLPPVSLTGGRTRALVFCLLILALFGKTMHLQNYSVCCNYHSYT
eukprot:GHVQ01023153.1.p1 GENE.GHVQ01023153.1~~GHVQ01023153.1.p1  ORF type:complete len:226 (+),score=30.74 GHVQ01023153.1:196-873(+)